MKTRAQKAGEDMGDAIIEMVNLMYQNNTALKFLIELNIVINEEIEKRKNDI